LQRALGGLVAAGVGVAAQSRFFRTPCFPAGAGPDYVNAAARLVPPDWMGPPDLLALLHEIEAQHGRRRDARWAGRTLDLDLIAWGDSVLPDADTFGHWHGLPPDLQANEAPGQLILPHPRMQDRAFVLVPLAEVAADWVHPVLGLSVAAMLAALPVAEAGAVKPQ
jgi:2-amino-4-hydroxy-6-hydroxymethyldihydropteridine diphosphokinase